jgi:hypothetical protein
MRIHVWQSATFWSNAPIWIGAIASAFAAFAAFYAARVALDIAGRQEKHEAEQRAAALKVLGPAVMRELCVAESDARVLLRFAAEIKLAGEYFSFRERYPAGALHRICLLEEIVPTLYVFGDAGAILTNATASILDFRTSMEAWRRQFAEQPKIALNGPVNVALRLLEAEARDCHKKIGQAIDACLKMGFTVPSEIVRDRTSP